MIAPRFELLSSVTTELFRRLCQRNMFVKNYQGCSPFVVASTGWASLDVVYYLMKINPAAALASFRS